MRSAILFVIYVLAIALLSPVILLFIIFGIREPLVSLGRGLVVIGKAVLGIKIEVSGADRFDPRGQYVFMPNHLSFLDGPLMYLVVPQNMRAIMKKKTFGLPIVGWAMLHIGFVPVDRKGRDGGKRSIQRASQMMREKGYSFLVFPEGTRSLDGKLQALRRGGFFLAIQGGNVPFVPVTITGARELMPKGRFKARRGTIGVTFHEPIPTEGRTIDDIPDLMARVAEAIQPGK